MPEPDQQPKPRRQRPAPPPWPDLAVLDEVLELFRSRRALSEHPTLPEVFAPQPTEAYRALLPALGGPYIMSVHCGRRRCDGPLGKWRMDAGRGIAVVHDKPSRPGDRSSAPRPFTAAASQGKGYRFETNTSDADGDYEAICSRCAHTHKFDVNYRTVLFLLALRSKSKVVKTTRM